MKKIFTSLAVVAFLMINVHVKAQTAEPTKIILPLDTSRNVPDSLKRFMIDGKFVVEKEFKSLMVGVEHLSGFMAAAAKRIFGPAYDQNIMMKVTHANSKSPAVLRIADKAKELGMQSHIFMPRQ